VSGTPLAEQNEPVEALPLISKRRMLGIVIPVINIPFFVFNGYQVLSLYLSGAPTNSGDFVSNVIVSVTSLVLGFILPWWIPVYTSKYMLEGRGLRISRLFRRSVLLPYREIPRAEVYIREPGEIPEDALSYTKDAAERLRKTGFSFVDFTNSEANIVLLMSGRKIYMISPAKPKAFLKSLKKRAPKLTAKIVELSVSGKNIQELT
jgi:hypothetical protein